eukprot:CAMPEP_0195507356 /NCGR_PEP_ID=MMETSP0794_2-20130614/825_1 /TAXON_ID=515487 /ORGANISM="Stephanopyxis turris, Strain CCMP 815" /LENGTH=316 /DNA_ID=CAMNT_0040634011 /DNA_START=54 /DNA_END=1004 /DNA_ORIENTATION=+
MTISIVHRQKKLPHAKSDMWDSYGKDDNSKTRRQKENTVVEIDANDLKVWGAFSAFSLLVYFLRSSGDFSAVLTFASMSRLLGFGILNLKIWTTKETTGISAKTLQLYCLVFLVHNYTIIFDDTYVPYDESATFLYNIIGVMSLVFAASALYACNGPFKKTYQEDLDKFGEWKVPPGFGALYIVAPCVILALLFHAELSNVHLIDILYAFALYVECVALLPQLYMFQKQAKGGVEMLTAHFVFAMGLGRILELMFWSRGYVLFASESGSLAAGYLVIFSQVTQILLMLDFFWYYCMAMKNDMPLILPSSHCELDAV